MQARPVDSELRERRVEASVASRSSGSAALGFDDVYAQHARFVFRVLRGMGVPDAQVDDALQDVFLVVHQRLDEFDARSLVTTWLFQIALRVAQAYRRKGKRTRDHAPLSEDLVAMVRTPLETAEAAQQWAELESLLDALGDEKRALLVLAELQDLTVPEIAEMTGTPLNTVYTRLRRARAAFVALWQTRKQRGGSHE